MYTVLMVLLAYLIGSIPSGLLIGKIFYKTDIREHGSGNLGATNTFRTLGVKAGIIVMVADILKGTLATSLPSILAHYNVPMEWELHPLIVGMVAVIGHMYPVFANFRGGKAVATSGGVILFYNPILFFILVLGFIITLYLSKYVSLSSMVAAIVALIYSFFTRDLPLIIVIFLFSVFIFYRHRTNIKRIKDKTEPKVKWL
ncbi:glycerol-3-phosphate 1-O-acyltransferase PlsY [Bacillus andreraoultii]|uniref:glycerol-3-phosphate 1-O-acyltransferase PlsY n=1 Tax=Bacillus andreraoultii TaxID=1499685 RepID=UPI00053A4E3A|nr:glycerol-3-phosphate 1-O-acyltransferase PlsY [Bacillus andreraoultii]